MDLLHQVSGQGLPHGQGGPTPRTQLQRRMGVSRAGVKEPTIKIELPVAMFRPPTTAAGPEMEAMKQLAAGGGPGQRAIPQPPEP